jgi:hypothetical protein
MNKNQHKLGNNISNRDKIMVNSPKVLFSVTRQYPEAGLKNNYILSYKNHLRRFSITQDKSYKKIPSTTLCKFWPRTYTCYYPQHIRNPSSRSCMGLATQQI